MDGAPVLLRECFIPLNPVRFSPAVLAAMDTAVPSALGGVPTGNPVMILKVTSDRSSRKVSVIHTKLVCTGLLMFHSRFRPRLWHVGADLFLRMKCFNVIGDWRIFFRKEDNVLGVFC